MFPSQIREFYLRFEKHTKLLVKYARIINDPNSDWTNLTYKNLINMLVNILANDKKTLSEKRSVSDTTLLLEESANALNLTPADSPEIWSITITLIGYWYGAKKMPAYDSDMHNEESKLRIVCILMCLALQTHTYHQWLDADAASEKKNKQSCVDEIKRLKTGKTLPVRPDEAKTNAVRQNGKRSAKSFRRSVSHFRPHTKSNLRSDIMQLRTPARH